MANFLDVDDSILTRNLLFSGSSSPEIGDNVQFPVGSNMPTSHILTPSERQERSQAKFIIPQPGMCIKTRELVTNHKVFINLCKSEDVPEPDRYLTDEELRSILSSDSDAEVQEIRLPMSLGEKHIEKDKTGVSCPVFEVVINTRFYEQKVLTSELYRTFLIVVTIEGVEEKFKMELDKQSYLILSHKKCIGKLSPQLVRNRPGIKEMKQQASLIGLEQGNGVPKGTNGQKKALVEEIDTKELQLDCKITQVSRELAKAEIKLPNLKNTKKLSTTLGADRIIVDSPVGQLDIFVPLDIHQEESKAEYNVATNTLVLHLPLVIKP